MRLGAAMPNHVASHDVEAIVLRAKAKLPSFVACEVRTSATATIQLPPHRVWERSADDEALHLQAFLRQQRAWPYIECQYDRVLFSICSTGQSPRPMTELYKLYRTVQYSTCTRHEANGTCTVVTSGE